MKKSELKQLIRECINEATSPAKATDTRTLYKRWVATRGQVGATEKFLSALGKALVDAIKKTDLGGSPKDFRYMGHNRRGRYEGYGAEDAFIQMSYIAKVNETDCHLQLTFDVNKKTVVVYVYPNGSQFGKYTDVTDAVTMKDIISGIEKSIEALKSGEKPMAKKEDDFNFS